MQQAGMRGAATGAGGRAAVGPVGPIGEELSSVRFAAMARRLSEAARAFGVDAPGFRSPPRSPGLRRSIRQERDGSTTVSVALRDRPAIAVIADMIDGVIVASSLPAVEAGAFRDRLWSVAAQLLDHEAEIRTSRPDQLAA